jgi:hypothetical protein
MYVAFVAKYSNLKLMSTAWRSPVSDYPGGFGMPEMTATPVVTVPESYFLVRYEPVAARVMGAGTPSAMPTGAVGFSLPEGAVLVSGFESSTSTAI